MSFLIRREYIYVNTQYRWCHFSKTLTRHCLYHVFTYIYSLLVEKDICDCRHISIKLPFVCVCLSSRDLFIFSLRVSSFFSYCLCFLKVMLYILNFLACFLLHASNITNADCTISSVNFSFYRP